MKKALLSAGILTLTITAVTASANSTNAAAGNSNTAALNLPAIKPITPPFPMQQPKRPEFRNRIFNISDYGARNDGTTLNTDAIRKTIEACSRSGGGIVVVPQGKWLTGAVHLQSNTALKVSKGAELIFTKDISQYLPAVETSWEGLSCYNYSPLIYAVDCENIALFGKGQITCQREEWAKWDGRPPQHYAALKKMYKMAVDNVPVKERHMENQNSHLRPQFVQFIRCDNVLIEGLTVRNSPFWTIHPVHCNNVIIRDLDIMARGHNTDGIDPDMCRNVLVEDCILDQGDDAICIKAQRNHDGWRGQPSENIVIRNCTIKRGHNLLAIGSELSGGIRNIYMHDCKYDYKGGYVRSALLIKTNHRRGGFVENIYLKNAHIDTVRTALLEIDTDVLYQWRNLVKTYERKLTPIKNIYVENVSVGEAAHLVSIKGEKELPIKNVHLVNVKVDRVKSTPCIIENAEDVYINGSPAK